MVLLGMKQCEIAEEMGLSKYGVSIIVRPPVFHDRLARRRAEHDARLATGYVQGQLLGSLSARHFGV